jgi:hypothetical protein
MYPENHHIIPCLVLHPGNCSARQAGMTGGIQDSTFLFYRDLMVLRDVLGENTPCTGSVGPIPGIVCDVFVKFCDV